MIRRIVMDTSTLVSAALRPDAIPDRAVTRALTRGELFSSLATLCELDEVLARSKLDAYVDLESRRLFARTIRRGSRLIEVSEEFSAMVRGSCRDAKDEPFLALALAANAEAMVSSDKDLLV
jgi:uncharacterized protein